MLTNSTLRCGWTAGLLAAVLTALLSIVTAPAAQAAAYAGPYQIKFEHSGKCLDLYQNQAREGAKVQQWTCAARSASNINHQLWVFDWVSDDGGAQIRKPGTNLCVQGDLDNGGNVYLWTCGYEVWTGYLMHGGPPDWYQLRVGDYCLDMPRSSQTDGQAPQMWSCVSSSANQHLSWW